MFLIFNIKLSQDSVWPDSTSEETSRPKKLWEKIRQIGGLDRKSLEGEKFRQITRFDGLSPAQWITDEQLKSHMNRRGREYAKVKKRTDRSKRGLEQLHPGDQVWRQDRSQCWGQVKWRTLTETKARPKDSSDPLTDRRDPRTTRKTLPKLKSIPHRRHL